MQAVERAGVGGVGHLGFGVEQHEDALAGGDALVDVGELVDERTHGARDLREHGDEGHELAGVERAVDDEHTAEDEDHADGRDPQKLAHRRCQLLAARHREEQPRELGVDVVEFLADVVRGVVALDELHARQRLVQDAHHVAHALLALHGGVAQFLDDAADDECHERQEEDREDRQFPRDGEHRHQIADDEERFAESYLQRVGDAELHDHHVLRDARHDVALALLAEKSDVEVDDVVEQFVAHPLQRARAHVLDRPCPQVAEGVRQQVHQHRDRGQQDEHVHGVVLAEDRGVGVAQPCAERRLVESEFGTDVERLETELGVEHRLDDRDEHDVVDRIEQRVEDRVDEIGDGVFADGAHEREQAEIYLEHVRSKSSFVRRPDTDVPFEGGSADRFAGRAAMVFRVQR